MSLKRKQPVVRNSPICLSSDLKNTHNYDDMYLELVLNTTTIVFFSVVHVLSKSLKLSKKTDFLFWDVTVKLQVERFF